MIVLAALAAASAMLVLAACILASRCSQALGE